MVRHKKSLSPSTIVALATPMAKSAISIVRLSGPEAKPILDSIWQPLATRQPKPRELALGWVKDGKRKLDQAMAVFMPGPRSYSGEDMVELHLHGSVAVAKKVLGLCAKAGARLAEPGEFTKRAFLNGKMDLVQAEAVLDLIESDNEAMVRLAADQLAGNLSGHIRAVQDKLIGLAAHETAYLDFSEEDITPADRKNTIKTMKQILIEIERLLAGAMRTNILRDGVRVVLVGLPNAGKSTLLNHLLGYERSIVTDIPGTTRDTIEESIEVAGVKVRLTDTAGLNSQPDVVEEIGIERTRQQIKTSDLILLLIEPGKEQATVRYIKKHKLFTGDGVLADNVVLVWTKTDLNIKPVTSKLGLLASKQAQIRVAALEDRGMADIHRLLERFVATTYSTESTVVTTARQFEVLDKTKKRLQEILLSLESNRPSDIILTDIEQAIRTLGGLTGETTNQSVIDAVFANFCIGK